MKASALVLGWALVCAIVVGGLSPAHAAPAGTTFRGVGTAPQVQLPTVDKSYCWEFQKVWRVDDATGQEKYSFGFYVLWCSNLARTKITAIPTLTCFKGGGGYWVYDDCGHRHSAKGYRSATLWCWWRFHLFSIVATPTLQATVFPNGEISGTVWTS